MIEMHVAIICACLPMCKLPLTYIFPKLFPTIGGSSAHGSSGASHHQYSNTTRDGGRNDWSGYPSRREQLHKAGISLATVSARTNSGDDTSEEYMLDTVAGKSGHTHDPEAGGIFTGEEPTHRNQIRMTKGYHVSYEKDRQ